MNIYKLTQNVVTGHGTYDSVVVAAKTAKEARNIHPDKYSLNWNDRVWCQPEDVQVVLIGKLAKNLMRESGYVICASFNAG